jgi:hypothetical protein
MSDESTSTAYHEASHAVAAQSFGLPVTYLTIRPHPDSAGRTKFDTDRGLPENLGDFEAAIIKVAGEVGARMAAGATTIREARFNWFADDEDAEHARGFIARLGGDELDARNWAVVRAYALLRTRWEAVEEIASKLRRHTTVLGEEVSTICLAEAARRSARLAAAEPPPLPRPDRVPKPAKKPQRRPSHGDREVRPFTFQAVVVEKEK